MERSGYNNNFIDHFTKIKFLLLILASISIVILIINLEGQETSAIVGNLLYTPVTFFMTISSYALLKKQRKIDDKDKGWIIFFAATISWLLAEHVWMITELVYHSKPFPSLADFLYIGGYILFGIFIFKMLWPLKNHISLNIKLFATLVVTVFLVPTIFMSYGGNEDFLSLALSLSYPIMDGILLWPGIIVLSTSFTSKSGKFWTLISIGIISLLIGDTMFSYANLTESYYTGYPFEIFFYIAYIMFGYASIVRTKQALVHTPLIEEVKEIFQERTGKSLIDTWKILIILSIGSITAFLILIWENFIVRSLSVNELEAIIPTGYVISGLVLLPIVMMSFLVKKINSLQLKVNQLKHSPYKDSKSTDMDNTVTNLIQVINKMERRRNSMIPIWISMVIVLVAVSTYITTSVIAEIGQSNNVVQSGRFLIENLQGAAIDTWATWYVPSAAPLHVTIVNSHLIDDTKLQAIKDAILSKETITIKNSQTTQNFSDNGTAYYEGWRGALDKIIQQNSTMPIPTNFEINESDKAVGDIIIILSTDSEGDGSLGFTKSISDTDHHQILKSFITIFDVKDLSNKELGDITRHEFGHALGLRHSSNPEDLMNAKFHEDHAYVSQCDIEYLTSLYGGHGSATISCFG